MVLNDTVLFTLSLISKCQMNSKLSWSKNYKQLSTETAAWLAAVFGVAKSQTWLSDWTDWQVKRNVQNLVSVSTVPQNIANL